jgi:hypothetical protein
MGRLSSAVVLPLKRAERPPRAVAAQLSEQILIGAEALFLDQGYGATTIEQVAGEIGATKRTDYVRFTDKAGLCGGEDCDGSATGNGGDHSYRFRACWWRKGKSSG